MGIAGRLAVASLIVPLCASAELPDPTAIQPVLVAQVPKYSEGVCIDQEGRIYFSATGTKLVYFVDADGKASAWSETGGPNGHKVLSDGSHLVCDVVRRAVLHLDSSGKVLGPAADRCDGKPLREPNDLTLDPMGGFYFTDPGGSDDKNPIGTVHFVEPAAKGFGPVRLVASGLAFPNGVVLRPDRKTLLVAESKRNRIVEYSISEPGQVGPQRVFAELPQKEGSQVDNQPDGMCLDAAGNLYVAHYGMGQVQVLNPSGKLIARYSAGNLLTSNVAFAGPKLDQLFVTGAIHADGAPGALFRLNLGVPGLAIVPGAR